MTNSDRDALAQALATLINAQATLANMQATMVQTQAVLAQSLAQSAADASISERNTQARFAAIDEKFAQIYQTLYVIK